MAYHEPKSRSIRLDDDVYDALRDLLESPNKFLRQALFGRGLADVVEVQKQADAANEIIAEHLERTSSVPERDRKPRGPLLKPSQRK